MDYISHAPVSEVKVPGQLKKGFETEQNSFIKALNSFENAYRSKAENVATTLYLGHTLTFSPRVLAFGEIQLHEDGAYKYFEMDQVFNGRPF